MYQELEIKRITLIPLEIREYKLNVDNFKRVYQFFLQHTIERQKKDESGFYICYCILEMDS